VIGGAQHQAASIPFAEQLAVSGLQSEPYKLQTGVSGWSCCEFRPQIKHECWSGRQFTPVLHVCLYRRGEYAGANNQEDDLQVGGQENSARLSSVWLHPSYSALHMHSYVLWASHRAMQSLCIARQSNADEHTMLLAVLLTP